MTMVFSKLSKPAFNGGRLQIQKILSLYYTRIEVLKFNIYWGTPSLSINIVAEHVFCACHIDCSCERSNTSRLLFVALYKLVNSLP